MWKHVTGLVFEPLMVLMYNHYWVILKHKLQSNNITGVVITVICSAVSIACPVCTHNMLQSLCVTQTIGNNII